MSPDMPESRKLFEELNLGVGHLSPGHFFDVYGTSDWPGSMFQELRDWIIVEARETGNHDGAISEINDYQKDPPNSRDNNHYNAQALWTRQEYIYRYNVENYKAVQRTSMYGLLNLSEVNAKFPGTFTDTEKPVITTRSKVPDKGK